MDAAARITWSPAVQRRTILSASVRESIAAVLSISMALLAIFLLYRRLAGGLATPLPSLLLIAVGLISAVAACSAQLLSVAGGSHPVTTFRLMVSPWLTILAIPAMAMAVSLPSSSPIGLVVLWFTVIGAELGLWRLRKNRPAENSGLIHGERQTIGANLTADLSSAIDTEYIPARNQSDAPTATQKLIYHRVTNGSLRVEGWLKAHFTPEQRTAIVHVAFCPAFDRAPNIEAELAEGPPAELRPTLVLPWGVRWEVKLDAPATEPTTAIFEFVADELR
jgi:hypothetical protein